MSTVTELFTSQSLSARVAAEVRAHAAKRGLKQKDLAVLLNLSPGQISARFSGRIPFKLEDLDVIAASFGIDAAELLPARPQTNSAGPLSGPAEDNVRRQGLEPRTRWFGSGESVGEDRISAGHTPDREATILPFAPRPVRENRHEPRVTRRVLTQQYGGFVSESAVAQ